MKRRFIFFLSTITIQHAPAIDLKKAYDGLRIEMSEEATAQRIAALATAATDPQFATINSDTSTEPSPNAHTTFEAYKHDKHKIQEALKRKQAQRRQLARAQTIPIVHTRVMHTHVKK